MNQFNPIKNREKTRAQAHRKQIDTFHLYSFSFGFRNKRRKIGLHAHQQQQRQHQYGDIEQNSMEAAEEEKKYALVEIKALRITSSTTITVAFIFIDGSQALLVCLSLPT